MRSTGSRGTTGVKGERRETQGEWETAKTETRIDCGAQQTKAKPV